METFGKLIDTNKREMTQPGYYIEVTYMHGDADLFVTKTYGDHDYKHAVQICRLLTKAKRLWEKATEITNCDDKALVEELNKLYEESDALGTDYKPEYDAYAYDCEFSLAYPDAIKVYYDNGDGTRAILEYTEEQE